LNKKKMLQATHHIMFALIANGLFMRYKRQTNMVGDAEEMSQLLLINTLRGQNDGY